MKIRMPAQICLIALTSTSSARHSIVLRKNWLKLQHKTAIPFDGRILHCVWLIRFRDDIDKEVVVRVKLEEEMGEANDDEDNRGTAWLSCRRTGTS